MASLLRKTLIITMRYSSVPGVILSCILLTACSSDNAYQKPLADSGLTEMVSNLPAKRFIDQFVFQGVEELEEGNLKKANQQFNRALKHDPQNPHLHFLNALTYQLRGSTDDVSHYGTAEAGYLIAMQFDPRNWMAAYQLGQLKFQQQRYREAQNAFAYGLLFAPDNPEMLQALAVASYYEQDIETALAAVKKAQKIRRNDPEDLGTAAMVNASLGEFDNAAVFMNQLADLEGKDSVPVRRLSGRIEDWKRFHNRNLQLAQWGEDYSGEEEDTSGIKNAGAEVLGSKNTSMGFTASKNDDSGEFDSDRTPAVPTPKANKGAIPKMTLVDVVIIRSEERRSTDKGINLMNGLQLTLTGSLIDYQKNRTDTAAATTTDTETLNNSFKIALPTAGITYNMNIFNDNDDRNEVLARPTLVALDGQPSEFFSGSVFHVELDGVSGSRGTVTDVPVGIKLTVTPQFLDKDTVQIKVDAARAFLEARSSNANFGNFAQVSKTMLSANVVMNFEETLVLSGLSEKDDEFLKDGVPFLQDIPGLQYLFSHEDTLQFTKSVLILITPHKPRYTYQDGTEKVSRENPPDKNVELKNLKELKSRPDWFKPASNLDATFMHLKDRGLFKEFQGGDVKMESWEDSRKLETKIKRTLEFLYY